MKGLVVIIFVGAGGGVFGVVADGGVDVGGGGVVVGDGVCGVVDGGVVAVVQARVVVRKN